MRASSALSCIGPNWLKSGSITSGCSQKVAASSGCRTGKASEASAAGLPHSSRAAPTTALQATPATWETLLAAGGVPSGVQLRLCGGEALPGHLAAALATGGARLWNVYGPTETTVWSSAALVG